MLWHYRERYLGILKNLQAAHGDSMASPLPPLRRQHANLCHENRESVMQYFGYVVTLVHLDLRWTMSCVLVDVQYGIFPLKHDLTRLQQFNTFPEVFCNHRWNSTSKIFRKGHVYLLFIHEENVRCLRDWWSKLIKSNASILWDGDVHLRAWRPPNKNNERDGVFWFYNILKLGITKYN